MSDANRGRAGRIRGKRRQLTPAQRERLAARLRAEGTEAIPAREREELPQIVPAPAKRFDPFPLTDLQQAYWVGRSAGMELGNTACYVYQEVDVQDGSPERIEAAWQRMVERHDMLRMVVLPDGRQQVLERPPRYRIEVDDLSGCTEAERREALSATRRRMSHQVLATDRWPMFELRISRREDHLLRLHMGIDTLLGDAWSLRLVIGEFFIVYGDPGAELPSLYLSFRDYVLAARALEQHPRYQEDLAWWRARLDDLPPAPELTLRQRPEDIDRPTFIRHEGGLDAVSWQAIKQQAGRRRVTPTAVLATAFADVLARWSRSARLTLNVPDFNRLPLHPQVQQIFGEFASFGLLQVDHSRPAIFAERVTALQRQHWQDLSHRMVGGVRVLRELNQRRGQGLGATMPVVFTSTLGLANAPALEAGGPVSGFELVYSITQTPQVWLDAQVSEVQGTLRYHWDVVEALFFPAMIDAMLAAFGETLETLARDPAAWDRVREDPLPASQRAAREHLRERRAPLPVSLLQDLVTRAGSARPEAAAVVDPDGRTLDYAELTARAHHLAELLRSQGLRPGETVAISCDKGWKQAVATLAVLEAGGSYLPLHPDDPPGRRAAMLERAAARRVVSDQETVDLRRDGIEVVRVPDEPPPPGTAAPRPVQGASDPAAIIFTSGSTGRPKGVQVRHESVVNALWATVQEFQLQPSDRLLALTPVAHDMAAFDLFGILAAGGTVVYPRQAEVRAPEAWVDALMRHRVTVWSSVPAFMDMLLSYLESREQPPTLALRLVFLGGDWVAPSTLSRLRRFAPEVRLVSVGGPTETTLWNIWFRVDHVDPEARSIPYGRAIVNNAYHVLNERLEDCPDYVAGQLYCTGIGVTDGYVGDEVLTAERYLRHPRTGERMYATGDLGRLLADGNIEILGRADRMLKRNGVRIEPGEIEAVLRQHPTVAQAIVELRRDGSGRESLPAWLVPVAGETFDEQGVRALAADHLPAVMLPTSFQVLAALPLNRNGKVDRAALPDPQPPVRAAGHAADAALGRVMEAIETILGFSADPDRSLIEAGADSIDLVRLANALEASFGFRVDARKLFAVPTARMLAEHYAETEPSEAGDGAVAPLAEGAVAERLRAYRVLTDPAERDAFKGSEPGLRRDLEDRPFQPFDDPIDEAMNARYLRRYSHRRFALRPIPWTAFGRFLGCLRRHEVHGRRAYLYPSGGGVYPMQVYLHVKPGRIEGLAAGMYHYDPLRHGLVCINPHGTVERDAHVPFINRPIFDEAAFGVFLVADLDAMGPMYGEWSVHYLTLEAGQLAFLLQEQSTEQDIGTCQVGGMDLEDLRRQLALEDRHMIVHTLLGGSMERRDRPLPENETPLDDHSRLLERIRALSPEQVQALLDADDGPGEGEGA